jgi:uncharacterized protein (DUF1697 family)
MENYIILLRGINVAGKNKIKMLDLKNILSSSGFENCKTYIQSGNIVFDHKEKDKEKIKKIINQILSNSFGIETSSFVFEKTDFEQLLKKNPFQNENTKELYFTFLEEPLNTKELQTSLKNKSIEDQFFIDANNIFIHCPGGYGKTKLNNNFFEKKLSTKATTRNYNTVKKLIELSD